MFTRKRITRHWSHIVLSLGMTLVAASTLVGPVRAADLKPLVVDPSYRHDTFHAMSRDIIREFRAYPVSFDNADDDDGDGQPDRWAIPHWVAYEIKALPENEELGKGPKRPDWMTEKALYEQGVAPSDASYHFAKARPVFTDRTFDSAGGGGAGPGVGGSRYRGILVTVWFTAGGVNDTRYLFRQLQVCHGDPRDVNRVSDRGESEG